MIIVIKINVHILTDHSNDTCNDENDDSNNESCDNITTIIIW